MAHNNRGGYRPTPQAAMAALPSALVFLAGIWLMVAPVSFDYRDVGGNVQFYWNEIVVGGALAVVALVRVVTATQTPELSLTNVGLGGWLIVSPFLLGYHDTTLPLLWNNAIVGLLVIVLSLSSWVLGGGKDWQEGAEQRGRP